MAVVWMYTNGHFQKGDPLESNEAQRVAETLRELGQPAWAVPI